MDNDIKIKLNLDKCTDELLRAMQTALEEATGELEAQVKRYTKVDTGQTKGSWEHKVDGYNGVGYVGSNYENAIWEEFGTGIHALNGNGRKEPWVYTPDGGYTFYTTVGKKPRRALHKAMQNTKPKIKKHFEEVFRGLND